MKQIEIRSNHFDEFLRDVEISYLPLSKQQISDACKEVTKQVIATGGDFSMLLRLYLMHEKIEPMIGEGEIEGFDETQTLKLEQLCDDLFPAYQQTYQGVMAK